MAKLPVVEGLFFSDTVDNKTQFDVPFLSLEQALGTHLRGGTIVQLNGKKSTGKTTLALQIIAQNQSRANKVPVTINKVTRDISAVFVDLERSYDRTYAKALGINENELLIFKPSYAEIGMMYIEGLLLQGMQLVIWDSVPAAISKDEFDKSIEDSPKMAESSRLFSRWLVRLLPLVDSADCLFFLINQLRANMQPMSRKETKPFGSNALEHYSKVIMELTRVSNQRDKGISEVEILLSKNKLAAEGGRSKLELRHGKGFNKAKDIFDVAKELGIIEASGKWYTYKGIQYQGETKALDSIDIAALENDVRKALISADSNGIKE
jgi:recombination protein RecA